jgi:hypothetical protein
MYLRLFADSTLGFFSLFSSYFILSAFFQQFGFVRISAEIEKEKKSYLKWKQIIELQKDFHTHVSLEDNFIVWLRKS